MKAGSGGVAGDTPGASDAPGTWDARGASGVPGALDAPGASDAPVAPDAPGASDAGERSPNRKFLIGTARALAGALIFALPMLMTMEMWWLGFYIDELRLALLTLASLPLLVGLSHYIGFEETFDWREDVVDALVAYAVAFVAATVVLALLAIIGPHMTFHEVLGKIAVQAVPGAVGALLAFSQLGGENEEEKKEREKEKSGPRYPKELFMMLLGALFLALNIAPTEEMILIAYKMSVWHAIVLLIVSLVVMHAFMYSVEFSGQATIPRGTPHWSLFLRFTVVGYAIALLVSLYALWTFGRFEGTVLSQVITTGVVLSFPAAIGAAAARLVL